MRLCSDGSSSRASCTTHGRRSQRYPSCSKSSPPHSHSRFCRLARSSPRPIVSFPSHEFSLPRGIATGRSGVVAITSMQQVGAHAWQTETGGVADAAPMSATIRTTTQEAVRAIIFPIFLDLELATTPPQARLTEPVSNKFNRSPPVRARFRPLPYPGL